MGTIKHGPFEIDYEYTPPDPGVRQYPDGSGEPPTVSEFFVTQVRWNYNSDAGEIDAVLVEFLAPVEPQGDLGSFVRERVETPDGRVPNRLFSAWLETHEDELWEAIDGNEKALSVDVILDQWDDGLYEEDGKR